MPYRTFWEREAGRDAAFAANAERPTGQAQVEAQVDAALARIAAAFGGAPKPIHPRDEVRAAAVKLLGLNLTRVVGEPDLADVRALQDDLMAIATIFDRIVTAYGRYVAGLFGGVDQALFERQALAWIEGRAVAEIERAFRGE